MRKLLKILVIILLIFLTRIFLSFIINEIIIYNYNHNKYNKYLIKSLYILNINEPYIAYYNHGNILFKRKDYKNAIEKYEKALKSNPRRNRICDIRINLSITKIMNIKVNNYKEIYKQLEDAKKVLYKNGCANKNDDNGLNLNAEKLENEINNLQEKINAKQNNEEINTNKKDQETNSQLEDKLKQITQQAAMNRQKELDNYRNINKNTYYSIKKW